MEPNYEWKFENGEPVALTGAFGIKLPEEIGIDRLHLIHEELLNSSSQFIKGCVKINEKLQMSLPEEGSELQFAKAFVYYQLHLHQEQTGVKITFANKGTNPATWTKKENKKEPYEGLNEAYKKRALLVAKCEEYVLNMYALLEAGASREKLDITPRQLYEVCEGHYPWFGVDESKEGQFDNFRLFLEILLEDGWVVFNNSLGRSNILPYGEGVPHYDADLGVEHPMWNN